MLDRNRWYRINRYAKKLKSIQFLGSKCQKCNENNFYKLCFHHETKNDEDKNWINHILDLRWSIIEKELKKCILLCYNCHHEIHYDINGAKTKNKKILLKFNNTNKCEICGYDKCSGSLDFHHLEPENKNLNISRLLLDKGINDIKNDIEDELNKCIVLCKNCHMNLHYNDGFLDVNYKEILKHSENLKEIQPKLDRLKIKEMYEKGIKQIEIAKHFGASKGTISNIIKELKIKKAVQ